MNNLILTILLGAGVAAQVACAQNQPGEPANPTQRPGHVQDLPSWQKFDLDFPGGGPRDLVVAIEKATGKSLNAIILKEDEAVQIPPMKFKDITVPDLFSALTVASQRQEQTGSGTYTTSYTFQTQGHGENAIFYFKWLKPLPPETFCRFYQLAENLQSYSIEDITTAIQTGWKMLGVKSPPQLKFHPETKLLIAVGPREQLVIIDNVLNGLRSAPRKFEATPKNAAAPDKQ